MGVDTPDHAQLIQSAALCPYRQDVPSGIWDTSEYDKLARYDAETGMQPRGVWQCHQTDGPNSKPRICAGWAGCHDGDNLLALRLGVFQGRISPETAQRVVDYTTPVPLFTSGAEAAAHGMQDLAHPGPDAARMIAKLERLKGSGPANGKPESAAPDQG